MSKCKDVGQRKASRRTQHVDEQDLIREDKKGTVFFTVNCSCKGTSKKSK